MGRRKVIRLRFRFGCDLYKPKHLFDFMGLKESKSDSEDEEGSDWEEKRVESIG